MSQKPLQESLQANTRFLRAAGALLVAVMLVCVVYALVWEIEKIVSWRGSYILALTFLVALESNYAQRRSARLSAFSQEWILFRSTEVIFILLITRIMVFANSGWSNYLPQLKNLMVDFLGTLFSQQYVAVAAVVMVMWGTAGLFAVELIKLEVLEKDLDLERNEGVNRRAAARQSMVNMILVMGGGITVLSAINYFQTRAAGARSGPMIGHILLFFVCSLALLSLVEYSIHLVRWQLDRLPVFSDMARRWLQYGAAFLLGLALLVSILPTGYSLGLMDIIRLLLSMLITVLNFLVLVLLLPVMLVISLINLVAGTEMMITRPMMPIPSQTLTDQPLDIAPWWEVLKSTVFWLAFLAVIIFSITYYLRQNQSLTTYLRNIKVVWWLRSLGSWLKDALRRTNQSISQIVKAGIERLRPRLNRNLDSRWNYLSLRNLSARQRVLFYYQALIRRAAEQGFRRKPDQTPLEFAVKLDEKFPDVQEQIDHLSEHFVEARYSPHEITAEREKTVRSLWQQIRQALVKTKTDRG